MNDSELLKAIAQIVQTEINPLKEQLASIDKRLTSVEDHVGGMESEHTGVKSRLDGLEDQTNHAKWLPEVGEIDDLRSRVRTLEQVVSDHISRDAKQPPFAPPPGEWCEGCPKLAEKNPAAIDGAPQNWWPWCCEYACELDAPGGKVRKCGECTEKGV